MAGSSPAMTLSIGAPVLLCCAASGAQIVDSAAEKKFRIPYPRPPNLAYHRSVLSTRGRF
jgi:hypothetical protein